MSIKNYEPWAGLFLGADGNIYNLVDLLGGGVPVSGIERNIKNYEPMGGLVIGNNNKTYDLIALLQRLSWHLSEMPEASEEWREQMVQFVGASDATYTNGYFYVCKQAEGAWQWKSVPVGGGFSAAFEDDSLVISG